MKLHTFLVCLFAPVVAYAGGSLDQPQSCIPTLPACAPVKVTKPVVRKQHVTRTVKTVSVPQQNQAQTATGTGTGTATVIVNITQPVTPQPKYNLGVQYRDTKPNRLLILGGISRDRTLVVDDCGCSASLKTKREFDIGAMYLRDIGRFTVGIAGTKNQSFLLAAGFNW